MQLVQVFIAKLIRNSIDSGSDLFYFLSKGRSPEKKNAFLWIWSKWERALPNFFGTFSRTVILVNKGAYFFQNANNLNFKLF